MGEVGSDKILENKLEILTVKNEVNLVTMAMGKLDDNVAATVLSLREVNKGIQDIKVELISLKTMESRITHLEEKVDVIESLPNKILWRVVLAASGVVGVAIAGMWLKGGA